MLNVGNLGERKVIEKILKCLDQSPKMGLPFGDDVAAVLIGQDYLAVLKTDMLVAETDIPLGMTLYQAARKAVIMNVSDFAAKGVKPLALLASLGLPRDMLEKGVEEIGKGLNAGVREYNTFLVGGDTGEANSLIICCMVFGASSSKRILSRSGARPGDVLAVTGCFGKTAAGLKILLHGFDAFEDRGKLLDSVYMPKARLDEGLALCRTGVVSASIDSSDGLAVSLHELGGMSNVGFTLTEVPVANEVVRFAGRNRLNATELALYGGEEYELVLTVKPEGWDKAKRAVKTAGGNLIAIGKATESKDIILRKENVYLEIPCKGWEHFKNTE